MKVPKKLLKQRGDLIDTVEHFFREKGFLRVETPSIYLFEESNPNIKGIKVILEHNGRTINSTLITSPEIYMKRLLAEGYGNIYQICKFFRNDEYGKIHNPEFLGLEFYEVGKDYNHTMNTTEELIKHLVFSHNLTVRNKNNEVIDFSKPFDRITIRELLIDHGLRLDSLEDREELKSKLKGKINISENDSFDDIFFKFFFTYIEPFLGINRPIFLYDYPPSMCSMAKITNKKGIRIAERYELYINQIEICNGFSELIDSEEQAKRMLNDLSSKGISMGYDKVFVEALKKVPECSGNAVGLDRLFVVLLNLESIKDIILFPLDEEIALYEKW
ncbi:MAG: hypothetical protein N2746_10670 [Deltaproteobacteria bacterium]|nr:hypothetical protein [Deltaproteobacteria bacterium]